MNWTAKLDQRQDILLLTFYMFVAMTLLVIRTGLDARGGSAVFHFLPPQDDMPAGENHLPPAPQDPIALSAKLDQLYTEALMLLCAAQAVARLLGGTSREIYELMNDAHKLANSVRSHTAEIASQCEQPTAVLDTS